MNPASLLGNLQISMLGGRVRHSCDLAWAKGGRQIHCDPYARLYLITDGEGSVVHHDRLFHLRPGYLFAIPAHVPGRYRCPQFMSLTYLHFHAGLFGSLEPFAALQWPFVVRTRDQDEQRFETLITRHNEGTPGGIMEADGLLRQLLSRFADAPTMDTPTGIEHLARLQPVLTYIEQNLSAKIGLAELANVAHLQSTYFSNLFSKHMSLPPMQYINRRRVERAAGLLAQGDKRVEEIASATGFSDVYYFSRTFKRFMGMPPTKYRAQVRTEA